MKPLINIRHGKLLGPFFAEYIKQKYPDFIFPTEEQVFGKIKIFREYCEKYNEIIIEALYEITSLQFKRNIIDVFVISATNRDMSAPIIIRSRYEPDEFLDVLIHELLHVFLGDNKIKQYEIEGESERTKNHITLFAIHKYIYLDLLKEPYRLERNIKKSNEGDNKDYARAWEIVNNLDYLQIIKNIKS